MTRFYLVRHGESEWNRDNNRYCGRSDINLSPQGEEQARRLGESFRDTPIDVIYSSPLTRARQTVQPVADHHGLPILLDDRLIEVDFGQWDGHPKSELQIHYADSLNAWTADPTHVQAGVIGETGLDICRRMNHFFQEKTQEHPDQNVFVLTHNGAIRLFLASTLGMPLQNYQRLTITNTGVSTLDMTPDDLCWVQINDINHHR